MRDKFRRAAIGLVTFFAFFLFVASPIKSQSLSSYDSTILTDHPVAYWGVNNPSAAEADLSGNGHIGTYKGGIPTTVTMLNGDKAADFNGTNQYLTIPSSSTFSIPTTKQLTWEGWIRPDTLQFSTGSNGYIDWMGKCQSYSPTCEWEARMYNASNSQNRYSRLSAYAFNPSAGLGAGADWQPIQNLLQAGQWLHVIGEYRTDLTPSRCNSAYPGSIDIWVNGVKWNSSYHGDTGCMSQYSIIPQASTSPINIGVMALDYWFKGAIGKVAIYNYLLTQTQINAHFTAMTGLTPSGSCADTCTTLVLTGTPLPTASPSVKPGDANGDGVVDNLDYNIWLTNSLTADFNKDGKVDGIDYVIWVTNFGK
jgi:hypothetical protein